MMPNWISRILTLTGHDFATAYKNKSLFLLVFVPTLICITLKLTDRVGDSFKTANIGLVSGEHYPPIFSQVPNVAASLIHFQEINSIEQGRIKLKEKTLDAVLLTDKTRPDQLTLVVYQKQSLSTISVLEKLTALQRLSKGRPVEWVAEVTALNDQTVQLESLPTWVLMLLLLVGFLILPAQVATEKESKQLFGILQTPTTETEWIGAKLLMGLTLSYAAVLLLHFLAHLSAKAWLSYMIALAAGNFYFCSVGILLGILCRTQASARALGIAFYIPHLLPPALSDYSQKMAWATHFIPSFQFYLPVKEVLSGNSLTYSHYKNFLSLILVGVLALIASHRLLKRRWLMS